MAPEIRNQNPGPPGQNFDSKFPRFLNSVDEDFSPVKSPLFHVFEKAGLVWVWLYKTEGS